MAESLVPWIERVLEARGRELGCYVLAWARVVPTVLLVPAFGLRDLAIPVRLCLALVMAAGAAVAVRPLDPGSSWGIACTLELLRGLPVALSAAVMLWSSGMTGAMLDDLLGGIDRPTTTLPGDAAGALASLFGLFAALVFLEMGGPARIVGMLFFHDSSWSAGTLSRVTVNLLSGVTIAVSIAAPVMVAAAIVELSVAFWVRVSGTLALPLASAPIRAMALVAASAWLLQRMFEALVDAWSIAP